MARDPLDRLAFQDFRRHLEAELDELDWQRCRVLKTIKRSLFHEGWIAHAPSGGKTVGKFVDDWSGGDRVSSLREAIQWREQTEEWVGPYMDPPGPGRVYFDPKRGTWRGMIKIKPGKVAACEYKARRGAELWLREKRKIQRANYAALDRPVDHRGWPKRLEERATRAAGSKSAGAQRAPSARPR